MNLTDFYKQFSDPYERRARLEPMLCAMAPFVVLLVAYTPVQINFGLKSLTAFLLYGSACSIFSAFSRNAGKARAEELKKKWGGWPSVKFLRHADATIDPVTKSNIHLAMAKCVPNTFAPTIAMEAENPDLADSVYRAWSEHLRKEARRDPKKYAFIFRESVSYGFHRNIYGLRYFAIFALSLAATVSAVMGLTIWFQSGGLPARDIGLFIGFLLTALFWIFVVTPDSVYRAAQAYALRLIDDCVPKPKSPRSGKDSVSP